MSSIDEVPSTDASTATAKFSSFDFSSNASWLSVESNLDFSSVSDKQRQQFLNKRKRKWFQQNIDAALPDVDPELQRQQEAQQKRDEEDRKATYKRQQEAAAAARAAGASSPTGSSSSSSFTPPYSPSSSSSGATPVSKTLSTYLSWSQLACHFLVLVNMVLYVVPLAGVEQQGPAFSRAIILTIIANVMQLGKLYGRPRWNAEYGRVIFQDEQSHFLFLSVLLINSTPTLMLALPFIVRSALFLAGGLKQLLPRYLPRIYPFIQRPIESLIARYASLYQTNALLEVIAGFILIFNIFTSSRNIVLLFGYWQYLRIRYMLSSDSKQAWSQFSTYVEGVLANPSIPPVISNVYFKIKGMMQSYTDIEQMQQQAQQPGLLSKCTIM